MPHCWRSEGMTPQDYMEARMPSAWIDLLSLQFQQARRRSKTQFVINELNAEQVGVMIGTGLVASRC